MEDCHDQPGDSGPAPGSDDIFTQLDSMPQVPLSLPCSPDSSPSTSGRARSQHQAADAEADVPHVEVEEAHRRVQTLDDLIATVQYDLDDLYFSAPTLPSKVATPSPQGQPEEPAPAETEPGNTQPSQLERVAPRAHAGKVEPECVAAARTTPCASSDLEFFRTPSTHETPPPPSNTPQVLSPVGPVVRQTVSPQTPASSTGARAPVEPSSVPRTDEVGAPAESAAVVAVAPPSQPTHVCVRVVGAAPSPSVTPQVATPPPPEVQPAELAAAAETVPSHDGVPGAHAGLVQQNPVAAPRGAPSVSFVPPSLPPRNAALATRAGEADPPVATPSAPALQPSPPPLHPLLSSPRLEPLKRTHKTW